ncbi:MAG: hypothetical protein H6624_04105 [Bdellovibrionaceae bacterium]|nr:hypothetical protein [Bdellovibrionales bacterium]MCB9083498.1 hypothetical protein [Pseudobdellovibrionaceae bacterium]
MNIPVGATAGGLTEAEFNDVLDAVQQVYGPIISAKGGNLMIRRLWSDGTVNASAMRSGRNYVVNMYGGLARHQEITKDGFALVACHETGHHIGGTPKAGGWFNTWASNEGQSDYFAVLKCLRRVFTPEENLEYVEKNTIDPFLAGECAQKFPGEEATALCIRTSMAGMSTALLFKDLRKESADPGFDSPDPNQVNQTDDNHPGTQCRLDTYFQGSLCTADVNDDVHDSDPRQGTCTRTAGFLAGLRPRCWYKPN